MIDLGVLGVLPWMLAEADGKRDRTAMRRLLSDGFAVGAIVGAGYLVVSLALWRLLPSRLFLLPSDRTVVAGPLALLVVSTALSYPLRAFRSVIAGLQDVTFNGVLTIVTNALNVAITWVMLVKGYGLWALAWATAAPQVVGVVACLIRTSMIAPDLMTGWTRPRWGDGIRPLLFNGAGVWFGTFGWQLLAASNSVVITYLGHPEWVAVYSGHGQARDDVHADRVGAARQRARRPRAALRRARERAARARGRRADAAPAPHPRRRRRVRPAGVQSRRS